ncbi:GGDEF domain-containing phosphodiesterase [Sphingomonas sp. KR1UV-12]|uniref:GGDEF domain-containing phosphodiesterase n=1 Tax=Sphingomonas aurea TaxID=3063994 RepID=A0ABT9EG03_9SPHN|nr:GGDEF domain-containing phosphodiesterase [Sphingomonas sp. KR1UV-12]MDP1025900.1 GGDEF domain-containing phosphodiesterase [Sphingomonas sp. KR1UV-12]
MKRTEPGPGQQPESRAACAIGQSCAPAIGDASCAVVVIARIANFAILRRHLGLARANRLASDIADRIGELMPRADVAVVARDRIDLTFAEHPELIAHILRMIDVAFEAPFHVDDEPCAIELLIGAAVMMTGPHDDVRLVDEAERALEEARDSREPVIRRVGADPGALDRVSLARDLRSAIGNGELFLHYQPKAHVRRQEITSVEALVRWQHPTRGLVLPGDFIQLAEESRDIVDLTIWTIQQAIRDQRILATRGHDVTMFVNVSGLLLSDARFVRRACALVENSGAKIGFEITETAVIRDPESAIGHLHTFAAIGIVIAIDDYGAGLSSLAYLKQLPARELKIDKLFVTQLTSSNRDPLIVRSTIDLAHALEMEVVAEGVETASALALLSVMGCDVVQGYFISRPIALSALIEFMDQYRVKGPERPPLIPGLTSVLNRAGGQ